MTQKIFDHYLAAIHKIKTTLALNNLGNVEMCILELSKVPMCEFHYDYIKNKYCNKSKKLFADSDSLVYEIETKNVYDDFSKNKNMFDFSN